MSKERPFRSSFGIAALTAVALAGSCTPRTGSGEPEQTYQPDSVGALEERYRQAGAAQTRYEDCMTRFFPNYREQVQRYGEMFSGGGDSGMPEHPALEGCKMEREESQRLRNTALGRSE